MLVGKDFAREVIPAPRSNILATGCAGLHYFLELSSRFCSSSLGWLCCRQLPLAAHLADPDQQKKNHHWFFNFHHTVHFFATSVSFWPDRFFFLATPPFFLSSDCLLASISALFGRSVRQNYVCPVGSMKLGRGKKERGLQKQHLWRKNEKQWRFFLYLDQVLLLVFLYSPLQSRRHLLPWAVTSQDLSFCYAHVCSGQWAGKAQSFP